MSEVDLDINTPVRPMLDYWYICPRCHANPDFPELTSGEYIKQDDGCYHWIGPTRCPECGQAIDLSELNKDTEGESK
jgi:hypothetical protein